MRLAIGIFLAALAAYVWGFLYWGLPGPAYAAWQTLENDEAAMTALRESFPRNGTYFVPGRNHDDAAAAQLYERGPVAFVHILAHDGRPMMDPSIMVMGFVHYIAAAGLLALVFSVAGLSGGRALKASAAIGVFAVVMAHLGESVWWQLSWSWKLGQALYDAAAITIMGAVLSRFTAKR